mgnify:CR=1 FL=1
MFGLPWHILLPTLLGSLLAGALSSALGVFIIRMKLTSLGFAMSHAAFAGAALGILLGVADHDVGPGPLRKPSAREVRGPARIAAFSRGCEGVSGGSARAGG